MVGELINFNAQKALELLSQHQAPLTVVASLVQRISLKAIVQLSCALAEDEVAKQKPQLIFRETSSLPHVLFKEFQSRKIASIISFSEHLAPLIVKKKVGNLGTKVFTLTYVNVKKVAKCAKAILKEVNKRLTNEKIDASLLKIYHCFYKSYLQKYGEGAIEDAQKQVTSLFFLGYLNCVFILPANYSEEQDKTNGLCISFFLQKLVNNKKTTDEKWQGIDEFIEKYQKYLKNITAHLCPK